MNFGEVQTLKLQPMLLTFAPPQTFLSDNKGMGHIAQEQRQRENKGHSVHCSLLLYPLINQQTFEEVHSGQRATLVSAGNEED